MSVLQSERQGGKSALRLLPILGSLLLALAFSAPARAVTYVTVDGRTAPITLTVGETVTIRFDVSKPGGTAQWRIGRGLQVVANIAHPPGGGWAELHQLVIRRARGCRKFHSKRHRAPGAWRA